MRRDEASNDQLKALVGEAQPEGSGTNGKTRVL
jgi:hypothetical protein